MKPARVPPARMSDLQLELHFPEHNWREPVRVRWLEQRPWRVSWVYGCAFCLYRKGLVGPEAARRMATSEEVYAHLEMKHPPGVPASHVL